MPSALQPASPCSGLVVFQPARGFRYGSEAFWVVGAALQHVRPRHALDLGTGSGIMALLLAARGVPATGVELRPEWAEAWTQTLAHSRADLPVCLERGDVRHVRASVDLVVCNPPYFEQHTGPVSPDPWKAAARTESTATLGDFGATARRALTASGLAVFVIPQERVEELAKSLMVERVIDVGRRLSLCFGRRGEPALGPRERWSQEDPRVLEWVALARGV